MRSAVAKAHRSTMCTMCLTTTLACSLYVRGVKAAPQGGRLQELLSLEGQIERTRSNVFAFLDRVAG
jgi:hypothetical protein